MNKEQQIEEMAKALTNYERKLCERLPKDKCLLTSAIHAQVSCDYCKIAEFLYNAGYRKVVFCKDCKWFVCTEKRTPHCSFYGAMMEYDDFCRYGKRKDND